ncbi:hypothetical protein MIND_00294100 [Mycena indigotica]|uniref:F-box domain-containing protein n=1 Tax=Mycena indigotica TaxID=2126181 RepID=A0A8H6T049_9AGAR|nr:uncharacterized protein MIND_00294100 [Mycena indigotica]KAF7309238.1 hypothetical protein MIND_00294100 [Mycena indigotica]
MPVFTHTVSTSDLLPSPLADSSHQREALARIENEIVLLSQHFDKVQAILAELKKEAAARLARVIYPVLTLPVELTVAIFLRCLPHWPRQRYTVPLINWAPLVLTRVCHAWRDIAINTPELWRSIFIQLAANTELTDAESASKKKLGLQQWVARAKSVSIAVQLQQISHDTTIILPEFMMNPAQNIKSLCIDFFPEGIEAVSQIPRTILSQVHHLDVYLADFVRSPNIPLARLSVLHITNSLPFPEIVGVMRECHELTELRANCTARRHCSNNSHDPPSQDLYDLHVPTLRVLDLMVDHQISEEQLLFGSLTLPNLVSLSLDTAYSTHTTWDLQLCSLTQRAPRIRHLNYSFTDRDSTIQVLKLLPDLVFLGAVFRNSGHKHVEPFLGLLGRSAELDVPNMLPNLRALRIQLEGSISRRSYLPCGLAEVIDMWGILDILAARRQRPPVHHTSTLRSLRVAVSQVSPPDALNPLQPIPLSLSTALDEYMSHGLDFAIFHSDSDLVWPPHAYADRLEDWVIW